MSDNDRICLSYWLPKIAAAGLPIPITKICTITTEQQRDIFRVFDGERSDAIHELAAGLKAMADDLGSTFFLRTGQGSGKHNWKNCCYVTDANKLAQHVFNLIEWSECVDMIGLPWNVWCVREYLPVKPLFKCHQYGDFPVVREFRVFVDGPQVLYRVPYWPDGAVEDGNPDDPDWQSKLTAANTLTADEEREIESLASRAGAAVGGKWSVDVLDTERGWFVTDMAVAERSYGWRE